ncbi:MAG: hypothetical protein HQK96_16490 [Nitrospirae bacterium]|nr:hypothetical protein [Nitrospirota bacterium]
MSSELYIDLVSKTIISMLSKEIALDVDSQVGARVSELLNNTLAGLISDQIAAQTDRLGRSILKLEGALKPRISELGARITEMSGQIIEKSGLTGEIEAIKGSLASSMGNLSKQITDISESTKASSPMKEDLFAALSTIGEALQKNLGMQIEGVSSKIDASFADMDKRMATIVESTARLAGETTIKDALQKNFIGQDISEKIDESIRQSLQLRGKEEGEMLKGVYYSMKKLINDFKEENEDAILFSKQSLTSMSDLRKHIEDDLGKRLIDAQEQNAMLKDDIQNLNKTLQHNVKQQSKLLVDIVRTIEKQLPFFSGKVDDAFSNIDARITSFERSTLSKITNTGTDFMKFVDENVLSNFKDLRTDYGKLMREIDEIRQLTNCSLKDRADMLQGVFLSVKKLLNISEKERDTTEKVAEELTNALDNLYSQIRRLESGKDELAVELLRLAGDDYFKNKFKQLENELHKAHSLAEKYHEEKIEWEQKYLKLQHEWGAAHQIDGE